MSREFLAEKHAIQLLYSLLVNETIQARGVPVSKMTRGWQFDKGGDLQFIFGSFWQSYSALEDAEDGFWWSQGSFSAGYYEGDEFPAEGLTHAFRCVELEWSGLESLLRTDDMIPPILRDLQSRPSDNAPEADSPGRHGNRSDAWDDWIAEVAWRAREGLITPRTTTKSLIDNVRSRLNRLKIKVPGDNTVWSAAKAVVDHLQAGDPLI